MKAQKGRCAVAAVAVLLAACTAASKPPGLALRQVWAGPDVDLMGAVSPDGSYLSFVHWETGDLAIRDLAAGESRRLTNKGSWSHSSEYAEFSVPSPDGKQIAYAWQNREFFYELRVIGIDGSAPRTVLRYPDMKYIQPAAWFPGGERILAILSRSDGTNQIAVVAVAGGPARVLKSLEWRYPRAALSPDGRWIAFDFPPGDDPEERDISLLASDGSREIPLLAEPSGDRVLGWTTDGSGLLFAREEGGEWSLWSLPVAEGKPQAGPVLVRASTGALVPIGMTDEGAFYYGVTSAMSEVHLTELNGANQPAPIANLAAAAAAVVFSRDGSRLAYLSRPAGAGSRLRTIAIRYLATGEEKELAPRIRMGPGSLLRWSPDGRSLLVVTGIDDKGRRGIFSIDAQTGAATIQVRSPAGQYISGGDWSPGGKAICYVRNDSVTGSFHIIEHSIAGGGERQLYREGARGAQVASSLSVSPDGRFLAMVVGEPGTPSAAVLKVIPAAGETPREMLRVPEPEALIGTSLAWMQDSREVLIARSATSLHGRSTLWRIPVGGGQPRRLELPGTGKLRSLSVHPDGRRIAFTRGVTSAQVWRMENWAAASVGPTSGR